MKKNADYWIKQLDLTLIQKVAIIKKQFEKQQMRHNVHHSVVYTSC